MGTKVVPISFGNNCGNWAIPAETPSKVFVMFWDILKGDRFGATQPPNLQIFECPQVVGNNCVFRYEHPTTGWWASFGIDAANSWIEGGKGGLGNRPFFTRTVAVSPYVEYTRLTNFYVNAFGNWGYDGFACAFWIDSVHEKAVELEIDFFPDILFEMFPIDGIDYVVKFTSVVQLMNMTVKFTP